MDEIDGGNRIDRREALKRGAAVTAGVWALPVIATTRAQVAPGSEPPGDGRCPGAFLTGGPNGEDVCVDDDLQVYVNGNLTFNDNDGTVNCFSTIPLGPISDGDQIRVVATDSFGVCRSLSPLYLNCQGRQTSFALDATGYPEVCDASPPQTTPFYDQTFTVNV